MNCFMWAELLRRKGIFTIGNLANTDPELFRFWLGKMGVVLWQFANGLDTSPVSNIGAKSLIKTVGNSTTAPRDLVSDEDIKITLTALMSVAGFVGYLKGKSSLIIHQRHGNLKYKYGNRSFWCRGYYVDTAGKNMYGSNAEEIKLKRVSSRFFRFQMV